MSRPASINPHIVESLYCEALVLSDEVRNAFDLSARIDDPCTQDDDHRIALSCEGLRTTTRMMHSVAWLLNHRAYFMGELSEFQLSRHGRLSHDLQASDPAQVALLVPEVQELIAATERFYARLRRLERQWNKQRPELAVALDQLQERLSGSAYR